MKNLPLASRTAARPAHVPSGHTASLLPLADSTSITSSVSLRQPAHAVPRSLTLGALVLSASLLAACGGGGADSQTGSAPSPVSGGTMIAAHGDLGGLLAGDSGTPNEPDTADSIPDGSNATGTAAYTAAAQLADGHDAAVADTHRGSQAQQSGSASSPALATGNGMEVPSGTTGEIIPVMPEDDIWFPETGSTENVAAARNIQTKATQGKTTTAPIIVRAPAFGPAGQIVRVGTPITRMVGLYKNGKPVAGFRTRDGVDIPNGRQATYTPTEADIGKTLVYREKVRNPSTGEETWAYSAPVKVVAATATPGSTPAASTGSSQTTTQASSQTPAQTGSQGGRTESAQSASQKAAASQPPVASRTPLIAGGNTRIRAGVAVKATPGTYQHGQVTQRQWLRNGQPIANATLDSYIPGKDDVGQKLSYVETIRNPASGQTITVQSQQAQVVGARYPSIHQQPSTSAVNNTAMQGQKLVGKTGVYQWGHLHINYWLKNGQVLTGGAEYTPTDADVGATIVYTEKIIGVDGDEVYLSAPAVKIVAAQVQPVAQPTPQPVAPATSHGQQGSSASGNGANKTGNLLVPGTGSQGSSASGNSNGGGNGNGNGNGSNSGSSHDSANNGSSGSSHTGSQQDRSGTPVSQNGSASNNGHSDFRATSASQDICAPVLSRNLPLKKGQETAQVPDRSIPATGVAAQEPVYNTCQVRVTHNGQNSASEKRHRSDYSRRQAFNADSSKFLMYASDGYWHLYDAHTAKYEKVLNGPAGDAEPQWHPTNPNILYFVPNNGLGMTINELNVASDQRRVVGDLGARLKSFWPNAATAWTKSEGAPSKDGRYWCLMVDNTDWQGVGVVTWDMKEDRIIGHMNLDSRPDHVSMSPSGNYCVVSWAYNGMGTRAYTRDFTSPHNPAVSSQPYVQLHTESEHSDLALNKQGEDVYVAVDYQSSTGDVFMVNLKSGKRTSLFPTYGAGTATALHISGKAYDNPGWVLVSTYAEHNASNPSASIRNTSLQQWFHRKVFAVSLEANPQIRPLAHADSTARSEWAEDAYWAEPQATVNRDFTRVLFNTNLNSPQLKDIETYMIGLNKGALDK